MATGGIVVLTSRNVNAQYESPANNAYFSRAINTPKKMIMGERERGRKDNFKTIIVMTSWVQKINTFFRVSGIDCPSNECVLSGVPSTHLIQKYVNLLKQHNGFWYRCS